ncbi:MAG: response regulator [Planctomycetes bacterium]|nr:response regulator [Planctomycetota bacterium]
MPDHPLRILLVEDNLGDAKLLQEALEERGDFLHRLTHVTRLEQALEAVSRQELDVVLLDLMLPDSEGLETFRRLQHAAPETPVVVFSGLAIEDLAVQAVEAGAQDYLIKGRTSSEVLARSLRYAVKRKEVEKALLLSELNRSRSETILQTSITLDHEINNALQVVIGQTEILLDKIPESFEDWRRDLGTVRESSLRIAEVLRQLSEVTTPVTKTYLGTTQMLDLERSSHRNENESGPRDRDPSEA